MTSKLVTTKHNKVGSVKGLTMAQKAEIIRSRWGAIKQIADELGHQTHSIISLTLDGKKDLSPKWMREKVLPAIDRKVAEILSDQPILKESKSKKKGRK